MAKNYKRDSFTCPSDNGTVYTIDTVPHIIAKDEFYCYDNKTGAIRLGKIIGKSAKNIVCVYEINGVIYKVSMYGSGSPIINGETIYKTYKCFYDYDKFCDSYKSFLSSQEAKLKKRKRVYQYAVDKKTFVCKKTSVLNDGSYKYFTNKKEAIAYAVEGLAILNKITEKFEEKFKGLRTITEKLLLSERKNLSELHPGYTFDDVRLFKIQAIPSKVNVGDVLFKVDYAKEPHTEIYLYFLEIVPNLEVVVTGFINKTIAKLSNKTVLLEEEIGSTMPMYIQNDRLVDSQLYIRYSNLSCINQRINEMLTNVSKARNHSLKYKPFETANTTYVYFNYDYIKKNANCIEKLLNNYLNGTV